MPTIELTQQQFDKLEEAADTLAMGHFYVSNMAEAVEVVAEEYIRVFGPLYEAEINFEDSDLLAIEAIDEEKKFH